jgi:hypothetical protein
MIFRFTGLLAVVLLITGCADRPYVLDNDQIRLRMKNGEAREVLFSCSLEGFRLQKAMKVDEATWEVVLPDREEFSYFFIVDGKVHLPNCRYREADDFGTYNCLYKPGSYCY